MKILFPAALAMLLPAQPAQQLPDRPAPRLERIDMDIRSWGRPVSSWSIDARGSLTYTRPEPGVHDAERIVTRRYRAGTAGFRRIRVLIGVPETRATRAGRELTCTPAYTDAPYGTARWTEPNGRAVELRFYAACRESATRAVVKQLQKADALAAEWGMAGEIVETRKVERQ